ncbi:MAG TPA: multicopper oxidase domain-containing protein [Rhizomicrobium sp.]|jgi:FtsP/CotA-like multicopper oxidase with cupredoxin domain|nr:multicopper oxidase domain-containing protein [Rhizomicrobium sp.]
MRREILLRDVVLPGLCVAVALGGLALAKAPAKKARPTVANLVTERVVLNAPVAQIDPKTHNLFLDFGYVDSTLYNPGSGRLERVYLRTWKARTLPTSDRAPANVHDATPSPFVAPTIEAQPGQTINIVLNDELKPQPTCGNVANINIPHCFNSTNLHTHGLWITPEDPGDNVLRVQKPGDAPHHYKYAVPIDHPGGTLWYHPHNHGSTALQVGGGASGALIIRGTKKPSGGTAHGEIDTLMKAASVKERILVLQQIQYACIDGQRGLPPDEDQSNYYSKIKAYPDTKFWRCDAGDIGGIQGYAQIGFDPTVSGEKWSVSGRFTTVNGETLPAFEDAVAGRIERWRLIDAGLANTISLMVRKLADGAPSPDKLNAADNAAWVAKYCTGPVVHQFSMANDGLTREKLIERGDDKQTILQPGYRDDVLMVFPSIGNYCAYDAPATAAASETTDLERAQLLGIVRVRSGTLFPPAAQAQVLSKLLVGAVDRAGYDAPTADAVKRGLDDPANMSLALFTPHPSLLNADPATLGHQEVAFNIGGGKFMVGEDIKDPSKDRPYDPKEWRILTLGKTDEWTITSRVANHPFHIHVNPFQIVAIYDDKGKDVSVTGEPDKDDMQYADLKGTWKDTIFIKAKYRIVMRTKYERFTGRFVMHCHILDHEDQGMMENIEIVAPGQKPLSASQPDAMDGMDMH